MRGCAPTTSNTTARRRSSSPAGNVQLDYLTQHVEADDARYELKTGRGTFHHVRATFAVQRRPTPTLLISSNPLYFEAEEADRLNDTTYRLSNAWLTGCDPNRPTWKFYAPKATIEIAPVRSPGKRKCPHLFNSRALSSLRQLSR